jgi:CRP/FNR family transcriptional regulator, nitrogen oxide reductase regulator
MKPLKRTKARPSAPLLNGSVDKPLNVQVLSKHFPTLGADKLDRLAEEMSLVRFKRGDRILADPHSATDTFLVLKGAIAITWQHDSRHRVLIALLAPGEIFGDSSSLPEIAQGLNGDAFANSLVAKIDSARLVDILLGVELAAFKAATEMTVGWSAKALMRYIKMFHMSPRERLVIALIEIGTKFGVRDSRGLILNLPMTQRDLADLLGASRQKINEYWGELVRIGAVINLGRQLILVPEKLVALMGNPGLCHPTAPRTHSAARLHNGSALSRREEIHQ